MGILMNNDFDINEFAKMFDAALASDNPAVKKALRNFMMIAAIVHAAEDNSEERLMGPLETLVRKVYDLENLIRKLDKNNNTSSDDYYKKLYGNQTWVNDNTYNPNTSNTNTTSIFNRTGVVWADTSDFTDLIKGLNGK
jgi:hypothetical protein